MSRPSIQQDPAGVELQHQAQPLKPKHTHFVEELSSSSSENIPGKGLETDDQQRGISGQSRTRKVDTGYNPPFLRRWVLIAFTVLWLLIIVSLQIVYSVSQSQKGLATTRSKYRYLWQYGGTFILVVVTVLWRQVDYAGKWHLPARL